MKQTTSKYIVVKKSKVHNKGVFAKKNISKGAMVIEYVGDKVTKKEADRRADTTTAIAEKNPFHGNFYIFELNKRYDIDGDVSWNTAKYINHSCNPNCESDIKKGHIYIISIKDIKKGEELSYDYGCDVEDYEDHPCKCGAKNCVGFIVSQDDWRKLRRKLAKNNK